MRHNNVFTTVLQGSVLLRPWLRLAMLPGERVRNWADQSALLGRFPLCTLGRRMLSGVSGLGRRWPVLPMLLDYALLLGALALWGALATMGTGIIGALTWGLLALVLLRGAVSGDWLLRRPTVVDLLVIGFVLSAVLSTAFSSFEKTSVVGLAKMMTFFAGYCVFRFLCEPGKRTGRGMTYVLLGGLVLLAVGETLVGLHQYVNHIQPLATWQDPSVNPELKMNRIFGTLKPYNPNLLAGFLIPCLPAAFGLTGVLLSKRRIGLSLLFLLAAGGITVALVLTGSRGGYLSLGGMLLCMFAVVGHFLWHDKVLKSVPRLKALWLLVLFGSVALGGLVFSVSPALQHRVGSIFAMREDSSNSYRLNVYNSAMQMAKDNPVVGIGPGNGTFKLVYGLYMVPGYNALGAYSVPLEIAVEQGLVGLTVFILLVTTLFLRAVIFLDSDRPLSDKLLVGLLFTGLLGSLIYGLFDTIWYRPSVNLLFWFFVAALAVETEALVEEKLLPLPPGTPQEAR